MRKGCIKDSARPKLNFRTVDLGCTPCYAAELWIMRGLLDD